MQESLWGHSKINKRKSTDGSHYGSEPPGVAPPVWLLTLRHHPSVCSLTSPKSTISILPGVLIYSIFLNEIPGIDLVYTLVYISREAVMEK